MNYLDYPLLKQKVSLLPDVPGSYQRKDKDGRIIYVGKAKSLVKRVKQYFTRPQVGKVARRVEEIRDFDIIETNTEKEALLLEISLIHKYRPKYNIRLRDDRSYPYIALKKKGDPFLKIARSDKEKGYYYFGPYPNSRYAYKRIDLLNKVFPLRKCKNIPLHPCLYYHRGECLAPCIQKVDERKYEERVKQISRFLSGDTGDRISLLKGRRKKAVDELNFEQAKKCKALLDAIHKTTSSQKIIFEDHVSRDIRGYSLREGYLCVVFLLFRKGVLLGKKTYIEELEDDLSDFLENLIIQFYENRSDHPKELIISDKDRTKVLSDALDFQVLSPNRGKKRDLLAMAFENARQRLDQHFQTARLNDDVLSLLEELKDKLGLEKTPLDIELYDNSHLQGYDPVGAMVKYINGEKAPQRYRKYKITQPNPQDDLASRKEVLTRRLTRLKQGEEKKPDLIILDGGRNQCVTVLETMDEVGFHIPLAGLAKNDKHETDTLINADTGEEIPLDRKSPLFFLLRKRQDEIHRFAITYHRSKAEKSTFKTIYDDIPGIGKKRKDVLLDLYPTRESLYGISEKELSQVIPPSAASLVIQRRDQYQKEVEELQKSAQKKVK